MRDLIQKIDNILKENAEQRAGLFEIGDEFGISFSEDLEIATTIVGFVEDGIIVELDDTAIGIMESNGARFIDGYLEEGLRDPKDNPCWKGYHPVGTKKKNGKTVPNCVPTESVAEGKTPTVVYIEVPEGDYRKSYDAPYMVVKSNSPEWNKYDEFDEDDMERAAHDVNFVPTDKFDSNVDEAEYQGRDVPLNKPMSNTDGKSKSKVYVKDPQTGNVKKVTFGDPNMRIKKSNPERRKSFRARHKCDTAKDKTTARYWSCKNW
jgi:hypothetical protein